MTAIEIPLYLLVAVGIARLVLEIRSEIGRHRAAEESLDRLAAMQEQHADLIDRSSQSHRDWKQMIEHQTGMKFSEISDAEIVQIVRASDPGTDAADTADAG